MYHQTQPFLTSDQVEKYQAVAVRQEDLVLAYFEKNKNLAFTPETINAAVLPGVPLTSVRRAISNLSSAGKLERVGCDRGVYGRPVGLWKFKEKPVDGMLF